MKLIILISIIIPLGNCGIPGIKGDVEQSNIREQLEDEAKTYLFKFGYMTSSKLKDGKTTTNEPTKQELQEALKRFQSAFLYYSSGVVDVPTQAKMNEWRCANNDMIRGQLIPSIEKKELWTKKTLIWKIVSKPESLTEGQIREAAHDAFEKWTKATGFEFHEALNAATPDITITFHEVPQSDLKIAASASKPHNSQIILDKSQMWAYKTRMPRGISLFHTLLHEIGHVLGLPHSFYRGSIMHPILKPAILPFGTQDDVPSVDRLAMRKAYGLSSVETPSRIPNNDLFSSKCPKLIDSVVAVNNNDWLLFRDDKVWKIRNQKFVDGGRKIQEVFPRGPQFVNATVSSNGLTLLFVERTIYGYEFDGVSFTEARDYPKELHDRVLFYPQAAFPLNNGSVILISGNVFATYNVADNAPSFLNDKNRYFPNLPDDLKSGVEKTQGSIDAYWMFEEATVADYDMTTKQVVQLQNIPDFLKCA